MSLSYVLLYDPEPKMEDDFSFRLNELIAHSRYTMLKCLSASLVYERVDDVFVQDFIVTNEGKVGMLL